MNLGRKPGWPLEQKNAIARRALLSILVAGAVCACFSGCTVWGAKNPPTVKSMTGAQDHEHVFWAQAKSRHWSTVASLLAPNVVYSAGGKVLSRDEVVPYLQSEKIRDFVMTGVKVTPNGPDMTLTYHLQLSSHGGATRSFTVVSVWQQVKGGWILIVHAEEPAAGMHRPGGTSPVAVPR